MKTVLTPSGVATSNSHYQYNQSIYPIDLDMDRQPFVAIRINQINGTTFNAPTTNIPSTIDPNTGAIQESQLTGTEIVTTGAAAGVLAGGGLAALGGLLSGRNISVSQNVVTNAVNRLKAAGATVIKGAVGGAALTGAAVAASPTATPGTTRLKEEIILYMPTITYNYGVQYNDSSTKMFTDTAVAVTQGMSAEKTIAKKNSISMLKGIADVAGTAALSTPGDPGLGRSLNMQANTRQEQIFDRVNFRTFRLSFDFAIRNAGESQNVAYIIKLLRFHMLPEFTSPSEFLYLYPSQFDLRFFLGGSENTFIPRIGRSVLTSLTSNYSPDSQWVQIVDGSVPHIKLDLDFTEIGLLDKSLVKTYGY
jgi:hypothetical protein